MNNSKGFSFKPTVDMAKRLFWFTPDYAASFKEGFFQPTVVTVQGLKHFNQGLLGGFKNLFYGGVGYAIGGKKALSHEGPGKYVAMVPFFGDVALTRVESEVNTQAVTKLGGMTSAVFLKYIVMKSVGTLTRVVLHQKNPTLCKAALAGWAGLNFVNTVGGLFQVQHEYGVVREKLLLKQVLESCESYGKEQVDSALNQFVDNVVTGMSKQAPGES
jgi:hypothetical protein